MEVVGLKQKVDNDINKLIAKFVGLPVHPTADMIKNKIVQLFELSYRIFNRGNKGEFKHIFDFYSSSIDEYTFYYKFRYADRDMKHNGMCRECGLNGRRLDWDSVYLNPDESIINGVCFRCINNSHNSRDVGAGDSPVSDTDRD